MTESPAVAKAKEAPPTDSQASPSGIEPRASKPKTDPLAKPSAKLNCWFRRATGERAVVSLQYADNDFERQDWTILVLSVALALSTTYIPLMYLRWF